MSGRPIEEWSDRELANLAAAYERRRVASGGTFTLAEVLVEQARRKPMPISPRELASFLLRTVREASDGRTTYLEVWRRISLDQPWNGHSSARAVTNLLEPLQVYCHRHGLPMLSVLVVPTGSRRLTDQAMANIHRFCAGIGVVVSDPPARFVEEQAAVIAAMGDISLPADATPI